MEAYLASIANRTNRKMLAKLLFIYLFIYLLLGEEQRHISFPSICNVMTYL